MRIIESLHNRALREARKLKQKKYRLASQRFCVEGVRSVEAALRGNGRVREAFVTREFLESASSLSVLRALEAAKAEVNRVPPEAIRSLAETESPQGIVVVADNVLLPLSQLSLPRQPVLLLLDGVSDPGNLGTLIRSAWSQGAHGVIVGPGCCDPLNGKAVRASMGGLFHVAVTAPCGAGEVVDFVERSGLKLIAATSGEGVVCDRFNFPKGVIVAVGNETRGVSTSIREAAVARVAIPEKRNAESLNAAAAGAVLLYEVMRQRRQRGGRAKPGRGQQQGKKRPPRRPKAGRVGRKGCSS